MVIGMDSIGSCKSNPYIIMTRTDLFCQMVLLLYNECKSYFFVNVMSETQGTGFRIRFRILKYIHCHWLGYLVRSHANGYYFYSYYPVIFHNIPVGIILESCTRDFKWKTEISWTYIMMVIICRKLQKNHIILKYAIIYINFTLTWQNKYGYLNISSVTTTFSSAMQGALSEWKIIGTGLMAFITNKINIIKN